MAYQEKDVSNTTQERPVQDVAYALDERRRAALAEVDNAKFSYVSSSFFIRQSHCFFFSISAGSMSRFALSPELVSSQMRKSFLDLPLPIPSHIVLFSYDIFAINIASTMLGYVYGSKQKLNMTQDLGVKVATPVGTLVGQVIFGWLADLVGRKRMCRSLLSLRSAIFLTHLRRCRVDDYDCLHFWSGRRGQCSCRSYHWHPCCLAVHRQYFLRDSCHFATNFSSLFW